MRSRADPTAAPHVQFCAAFRQALRKVLAGVEAKMGGGVAAGTVGAVAAGVGAGAGSVGAAAAANLTTSWPAAETAGTYSATATVPAAPSARQTATPANVASSLQLAERQRLAAQQRMAALPGVPHESSAGEAPLVRPDLLDVAVQLYARRLDVAREAEVARFLGR